MVRASLLLSALLAACSPAATDGNANVSDDTMPTASASPPGTGSAAAGDTPIPVALAPYDLSQSGLAVTIDLPCPAPAVDKAGADVGVTCPGEPPFSVVITAHDPAKWTKAREADAAFSKWIQTDERYIVWAAKTEDYRGFATRIKVGEKELDCASKAPSNDGRNIDTMVRACQSIKTK